MKKKLYYFDTVCLIAILLLLFSIGIHIGKDRREDEVRAVSVTLSVVKSKSAGSDKKIAIDGKYPCTVTHIESDTLTFVCSGKYREAGFLTAGAKYLTKNQPIELVGENFYIYGRIINIESYDGPLPS